MFRHDNVDRNTTYTFGKVPKMPQGGPTFDKYIPYYTIIYQKKSGPKTSLGPVPRDSCKKIHIKLEDKITFMDV